MKKSIKDILKEIIPYVIVIVLVLVVKTYVVSPIKVNGSSMDDTLNDSDIMILDEISYRFSEIERFDIVVLKYDDEYLIKRVIGLPGEKIKYENNILYVNGKKVKENFSHAYTEDFDEVKIPEGKYFVLGDNRVNSTDSRILGFFDKSEIKGKTSLTIFPFSRFGIKE